MSQDQLVKYELRGRSKWSKSCIAKILNSKILFSLSPVLSSISSTLFPAHNIFILVLPFLLIHSSLLHLCMPKTVFPSLWIIPSLHLDSTQFYGVSARSLTCNICFHCLLVHSMIPKQLFQIFFYSPSPTGTQSLTSHSLIKINAMQREQS